jgi:CHRD domain
MVRYAALAAVAALVVGCAEDRRTATEPEEITIPLYSVEGTAEQHHATDLSGSEEVPPRDTPAGGLAIFREQQDSDLVDFHLVTSKIVNVNQAHIHCGAFGANGPVRMWLFPVIGPSGAALVHPAQLGKHTGVLNSGTFNPTGVTCPDGTALIDAMRAGLAYVNVHTTDGVDPVNTGPGDFPGGEIRGQLNRREGH